MNKEIALVILFSLLLPLCLLLVSYKVTLFFIPLTSAQETTFDFLQGNEEISLNYTLSERSHLEDVRQVMKWADILLGVVLVGILFVVLYSKDNTTVLQKSLWYGGIVTVSLLFLILLLTFLNFTALFTFFHQLFFPQGNWMFPADSLLIQTFPADFFVKVGRTIFIDALLLGIGTILLSQRWSKQT